MIERIQLSEEEIEAIERLDKAGLLHDLDKKHFCGKEDVAVIFCNDGRWALRIIDGFREMYDKTHELCFLPIPEFGGTLVLDEGSPLVFPGHTTDIDFIGKVKKAVKMGYRAFCNINHIPCAMGREYEIPPLHIVDSLMMAKRRIKGDPDIAKTTIANFIQIGDGNGRVRIARIPSEDYLLWRKDNSDGASPTMLGMLAKLL